MHLRTRSLAILGLIVSGLALTPALVAARPPDFSHPRRPHYLNYDPIAGTLDRPLLVLYERFSDLPFPPGRDAAWLSLRIFGKSERNVAEYFWVTSHGNFILLRATESCGDATGGVVAVDSGTRASWEALTDGQRIRNALAAADPCVDYGSYDTNGNGAIEMTELVILKMEVQPTDDGTGVGGGAATRGADPGPRLDGVSLDWVPVGLVNSATNLMTTLHEIMHAGLGMARDWYQFGIDGFDIMANTIAPIEFYEGVSSWHAMHLGWSYPTVALRDGYVTLDSFGLTGRSLLLYDPARGARHYLLVENRTLDPGSYDEDPSAMRGLNVWRVDETRYYEDAADSFPIKRIRPCEGDGCPDGWYFSTFDGASAAFPERTVEVPWNDGTPSRVAIRAIGAAGPSMRFFVDVPGPGALVDCFSVSGIGSRVTLAIAPGSAGQLVLPLMNTGDAPGRFDVRASRAPAGWSVSAQLGRRLSPHVADAAALVVGVPADTSPGTYAITIQARATAHHRVGSSCEVAVVVP